ncbi:MAG: phosphatidylglycerophosphatase A [Gammaproteobacteria bacterium]
MKRPAAAEIFRDPVHFLAFGFGAGLAPRAPGTAGTLVAVPIELLLRPLGLGPRVAVVIFVCAVGFWICGESARRLGEHDHPGIVWDEIAGYLLAMLAAPTGWPWVIAGFALFRLFDILKPWPIRDLDHGIGGGTGIMLDDIVAGLFAGTLLFAARLLLGV